LDEEVVTSIYRSLFLISTTRVERPAGRGVGEGQGDNEERLRMGDLLVDECVLSLVRAPCFHTFYLLCALKVRTICQRRGLGFLPSSPIFGLGRQVGTDEIVCRHSLYRPNASMIQPKKKKSSLQLLDATIAKNPKPKNIKRPCD